MKQLDILKKNIVESEQAMEAAGVLDGMRMAAALYCMENYPDEAIWKNVRLQEIMVYEICRYLESEA